MDPNQVEKAVFRLTVGRSIPDFERPWQTQWQDTTSATGFAIGDKKIITNAHAINRATIITIKKIGSDERYVAEVLSKSQELDLALLKVQDDSFWEDIVPLEMGNTPDIQAMVSVFGYPRGGENLSVTRGVVSRIEMTSNVEGSFDMLTLQIDAAINPGNSGGPVLDDNLQAVGVAFMKSTAAEDDNVGYIVAADVVRRFLADFEKNNAFTGVGVLGIRYQAMESLSMRNYKGMEPDESGILVQHVQPALPVSEILFRGDVILTVDGRKLTNLGKVPHRNGELISFDYLFNRKFVGEEVILNVLRDGKRLIVNCPLSDVTKSRLVAVMAENKADFFITGGLLFTKLTHSLLQTDSTKRGFPHLQIAAIKNEKSKELEEVVVLTKILTAPLNFAYEDYEKCRVHKFNGTDIRSLSHLATMVETCKDKYLVFDLDLNFQIILDREDTMKANASILEMHGVPSSKRIS